ncbi:hypothetical protein [Streptomyces malaysiensis]
MSDSRAYWQWTLTLKLDGEDIIIPGSTDAPGNSTKDTILPGILSDIFGDIGNQGEPMSGLEITHQSVRDYVAARKRGDSATAERIKNEVIARFESRTTDGAELVELGRAVERLRPSEDL